MQGSRRGEGSEEADMACKSRCGPMAGQVVGRRTIRSTLDPLLESLARDYIDDNDLSRRLRDLFEVTPLPPPFPT